MACCRLARRTTAWQGAGWRTWPQRMQCLHHLCACRGKAELVALSIAHLLALIIRCRPPPICRCQMQNSKGVVWGTYMIKVDTMAGLRASRAEIDQIWRSVRPCLPSRVGCG